MKWYEVELEMPIYGKTFETVQASDLKMAKIIAIRKAEIQYNFDGNSIFVIRIKEINL